MNRAEATALHERVKLTAMTMGIAGRSGELERSAIDAMATALSELMALHEPVTYQLRSLPEAVICERCSQDTRLHYWPCDTYATAAEGFGVKIG